MAVKKTISISIIGHNEAKNLPGCFQSITWADEIVFVDCGSEDNSIDIARKYTSKVFARENNRNLNINKQFAIEQCTSDWIFYLDPDEIIPDETAVWINDEIQHTQCAAFQFNRKNYMLGKWLKYGRQYPDRQLRLFKRGKAYFPCKHVHEKLKVTGAIGRAPCDFLHHPYPTLEIYMSKFDFYTTFEASFLYEASPARLAGLKYLFFKPLTRFVKRYILYLGFMDGYPGFVAAFFDMLNFPVRYLKYIEIKNNLKK